MEQKNFLHSLLRVVCGKKSILMITDAAEILSRQEEFEKNGQYKESFQKVSESIRNSIISGGALALALSLSMVRYFPSKFSTLSINKIFLDIVLISTCLFTATTISLRSNSGELNKIKKDLMVKYDRLFLNHMAEIQIKFQIDQQDQVQGVFTQQQFKDWSNKRHGHIF